MDAFRKYLLTLGVAAMTSLVASSCAAPTDFEEGDENDVGSVEGAATVGKWVEPTSSAAAKENLISSKYGALDPKRVVPRGLFENAIAFYDANSSRITNKSYVTVVDFSAHSGKHRFFMINMKTGAVEPHVVAHGSGSDPGHTGYATKFSNTASSHMTSLGYFLATDRYYSTKMGKNAVRLQGLSTTNSNVMSRGVVIHKSDYVSAGRSPQGRSQGCLALPNSVAQSIEDRLDGGSLIYAERSKQFAGATPGPSTGNNTTQPTQPTDDEDDPPGAGTGTGSSGGTTGGQRCTSTGDCNPGNNGSGLICSGGYCKAGCLSNAQCPGSTTCVGGQCR